MKNTIHFFGDSFTEGYTLQKTKFIWPKVISRALPNYSYKNYGEGGASPLFILRQIIKNLHNIKSGDKVFLLETIPDRIEVYSKKLNSIISVTNGHMADAVSSKENVHFKSYEDILSAFNFVNDHRFKNINKFENFFREMHINFGEYFKTINVEFILLPYHLSFDNIRYQDKFETTKQATGGKNTDAHFSILGHWQFANYINNTYLNSRLNIEDKPKEKNII